MRTGLSRLMFVVVVALAVCFALGSSISMANTIGFMLNGNVMTWDRAEYGAIEVINGRTLIPLRIVSNKLGYSVEWDGTSMSAVVIKGEQAYRFPIGKAEIITPNGTVRMDVPNIAIQGRTYLPLRAFFEAFGLGVDWKSKQDVHIKYGTEASSLTDANYVVVTASPAVDAISSATKNAPESTTTVPATTTPPPTTSGATSTTNPSSANGERPVSAREIEMKEKLVELKKAYPDGLSWTNENRRYEWNDVYEDVDCYIGTGCVAFAFEISDKLFDRSEKARRVDAGLVDQIRIGDIVRMDGNSHSAVVIDRDENGITLAEGNFNKAVMWGRQLTYEELRQITDYFITRYK